MVDLSVSIGRLKVTNPVCLAAGPFGATSKGLIKYARAGCGAVASKSITVHPKTGNPSPRMISAEPVCWVNAEGGPNVGIDAFVSQMAPHRAELGDAAFILCLTGNTIEEYVTLATRGREIDPDVVQVVVGAPNRADGGAFWAINAGWVREVISSVRAIIEVPLWVKLPTHYGNLLDLAEAAEAEGAEVIVPTVTQGGLPIDVETGRPKLGFRHGVGNCTGPATKFSAIKAVADLVRTVRIPVVGTGGAATGLDVAEHILAGAHGVQSLSVFLRHGPAAVSQMLDELRAYMGRKGYAKIDEFRGKTLEYLPEKPFPVWYRNREQDEARLLRGE